jgi:hypothetical protein
MDRLAAVEAFVLVNSGSCAPPQRSTASSVEVGRSGSIKLLVHRRHFRMDVRTRNHRVQRA